MTGKIDFKGEVALIEENGKLSIYNLNDVEEDSQGGWVPKTGAEPSKTLAVGTVESDRNNVEEVSVGGGPAISDLLGNNLEENNGTLESTGSDTQLTDEEVQDIVGNYLSGSGSTSINYDDPNNVVTISSTDTDTQRTNEEIQDVVAGLLAGSGSTTVSYDDSNNTLTIESTDTDTQLSESDVRNAVEGNTDVSDLSGSAGSADQVAQTDGSNVTWADLPSGTTDTRIDVADSGGIVVSEPDTMTVTESGDASVTVSDDGSGGVTVNVSATDTNTQAFSVAASGGPVSLSGGEEVVIDTGHATTNDGHFFGTAEVPDGMDYAVSTHRDTGGSGNWKIHVEQNTTAITSGDIDWVLWEGNP